MMKKLTAAILCLVLVLSLCVSAFAQGEEAEQATVTEMVEDIITHSSDMTDEEICDAYRKAAEEGDIRLTEKQLDALVRVTRSLEGLNEEDLRARAELMADNFYQGLKKVPEKFMSWLEDVENGDYTWEDAKDNLFNGISTAADALSGFFGSVSDYFSR